MEPHVHSQLYSEGEHAIFEWQKINAETLPKLRDDYYSLSKKKINPVVYAHKFGGTTELSAMFEIDYYNREDGAILTEAHSLYLLLGLRTSDYVLRARKFDGRFCIEPPMPPAVGMKLPGDVGIQKGAILGATRNLYENHARRNTFVVQETREVNHLFFVRQTVEMQSDNGLLIVYCNRDKSFTRWMELYMDMRFSKIHHAFIIYHTSNTSKGGSKGFYNRCEEVDFDFVKDMVDEEELARGLKNLEAALNKIKATCTEEGLIYEVRVKEAELNIIAK
jgi:hypothetical protein